MLSNFKVFCFYVLHSCHMNHVYVFDTYVAPYISYWT